MCGSLAQADIHTNQKAELTAVIRALQLIRVRKIPCGVISIFTDSKYAVQGLNEWIPRWRHNGYRTSHNHGVVNADLFRSLDHEVSLLKEEGIPVKIVHVPRAENRKADALSKMGAKYRGPQYEVNHQYLKASGNCKPPAFIGRDLMVKARPVVQCNPDGMYWATKEE